MMLRVGQKVVCVDDADWLAPHMGEQHPVRGQVYTVRRVIDAPQGLLILVSELRNRRLPLNRGYDEPGFFARRFRPVVERKTDISIFTRMLREKVVEVSRG